MQFLRKHCPPWYPKSLIGPLVLLTGFALLLGAASILFRAVIPFLWQSLLWNMFLAGIPLVFACGALWAAHKKHRFLALPLLLLWLCFYPNTPYILTDFIHLRFYEFSVEELVFTTEPAIWFGFLHLCAAIVTGYCFGIISLVLLQRYAGSRYGKTQGWLLAAGMMPLSGVGIWIGRCMRFNSWDIVHHPLYLLRSIAAQFDRNALLLCILFTIMSAGAYLLLRAFLPEDSK